MKRILSIFLSASVWLLMPLAVFAGTVTTTQEFTLNLPSTGDQYTLKNGSTFNSLDVSGGTFVFTLDPKDQIILISPGKRNLTNTRNIPTICNSDDSRSIQSVATTGSQVSVTITPSGTCTVSTEVSSTSSGGGGGGSSGGGGTSAPAPAPSLSPTPSPSSSPISTSTPSATPSPSPLIPSQPIVALPPVESIPQVLITRSLGIGSQGDDVRDLQTFLAADASIYPGGIISGFFGPKTQVAIKRFQEKYGIASKGEPGYGVVGPKTRAKLKELSFGLSVAMPISIPSVDVPSSVAVESIPQVLITRSLGIGSQGDDVRDLQTFLAADASIYPGGIISGFFGPKTQVAIKRFQEKYGIASKGEPGYGVVGPKTRAKLKELSNMPSSPPLPSPSPLSITPPSSSAGITDLQAQIKALQDAIDKLKKK